MEEDGWDLQAVVRGFCGSTADAFSPLPPLLQEGWGERDDGLLGFTDIFAIETGLHEIEELCGDPFFPSSPQPQSQQQQQLPSPLWNTCSWHQNHQQQQKQQLLSPLGSTSPWHQNQQQQQLLLSPRGSTSSGSVAPPLRSGAGGAAPVLPLPQQPARQPRQRALAQTPRAKRRKSQQNKLVCQVPADGVSSDKWAWRKYGQKPIKGSPYPRGYYRCSSSKGCLARKQVERSRTDPDMFVITYTGEHNHPAPTHRNALAGSTRHRFPPSSAASPSAQEAKPPVLAAAPSGGRNEPEHSDCKSSPSSPLSSPGLSPTTTLAASTEEELLLPRQRGGQKPEKGAEVAEEEGEDLLLVGDIEMLGEDDLLFVGLEELRQPNAGAGPSFADAFSDHFGGFPTSWTMANAAAAAAAAAGR